MRRTVAKLAMNKATFLSLSNQMTEQLGALWEGQRPAPGCRRRPTTGLQAALQLCWLGPSSPPARPCPAPTPARSLRSRALPAAMTRVAGSLAKSGEVLKLVNGLMKVPQLQKTMIEMSRGAAGWAAGWRAGLQHEQGRSAAGQRCHPCTAPTAPTLPCPAAFQRTDPFLQRWPRRASLTR